MTPGGSKKADMSSKRNSKRIARKPGDLYATKLRVWRALLRAEELLESELPETALRAVHAVSQAAMCYAKLHEISDLETELQSIKALLDSKGML
jgi:hypothetical protein